jgi:hypothetical protein
MLGVKSVHCGFNGLKMCRLTTVDLELDRKGCFRQAVTQGVNRFLSKLRPVQASTACVSPQDSS